MVKISISSFNQSCTDTVGISVFQKECYLWESYLCFTSPLCHQSPCSQLCNSDHLFSFPFSPSCFSRTQMGSTCTTGPCLMDMLAQGQLWLLPNCCSTTSWNSCRRLWTSWGTQLSSHPPAWERSLTTPPATAGHWHGQPPCAAAWEPRARPARPQHASSRRRRSHMSAWLLGP